MTKVFISWTGRLGRKLAECLKNEMFKYGDLEPWISSEDITSGSPWFQETSDNLNQSNYGVVCLTPGASKRPWINFEIGWLYGKLENCKLITFGEEISNPLACLQKRDGFRRETWDELLQEMLPERRKEEIDIWLNDKFPKLQSLFDNFSKSPYKYYCNLDKQFSEIHNAMDRLKKNTSAQKNVLFQKIITKSYADLINYSNNLKSTYSIPASEYSKYLIHLQELFYPHLVVQAIALVDVEEEFWKLPTGKKISNTSNENNERIFVFTKPEDFQSYYKILQEHSRKYKVYGMSYARLSNILGENYTKDFSVITISHDEKNNSSILAMYDNELLEQKNISFVANTQKINEYQKQFDLLINSDFLVEISCQDTSEQEIMEISDRIFSGLTQYKRKWVEMSEYIDVVDYDEHEEKHEYYQEMTKKMIGICQKHSSETKDPLDVLELGAGTGIFTMKVVNSLRNLRKIDAIEVDWHCFKLLKIKKRELRAYSQDIEVNLYHKDSRDYNPPGQFDYIFSAFADHHIKKADKEIYFENVKKNLKHGGLMIVGDEFLREHDSDNREEKEQALNAYHNHIIQKALEKEEGILATLEQQALDSGLRELGDFKVSCSEYEKLLKEAGFKFTREKIGPLDIDDIGGVYVYKAWIPK
ncbi:methyltransferase domain-containing protein [Crocosphaera sp.]|uniref:methyltransferase domain-containing protein n=1 Tax=Crocosphaera sp. TaxID=2729996 RepID=UPI00262376F2|nr:methyltransferase domain-containing protein [Crocosphaera sp.]MDJ0580116.1 methyltransferase domain-containing protein [Crocosphaera sp.]